MGNPLTSDQVFIDRVIDIILKNLGNQNFGVNELSLESGLSRSSLRRRLKSCTGKSANQLIREVRLQKAMEMLQSESVTASEVAYRFGFSSPAYFSTCFHEYFGYPPGKVNKIPVALPKNDLINLLEIYQPPNKRYLSTFPIKRKWGIILSALVVIVAVLIILFAKPFSGSTIDDLRSRDGKISIAVFPFQNMTEDRIWDGIQMNLISYLSNFDEFVVHDRDKINGLLESEGLIEYASIQPDVTSIISRKLDANVFISGSVIRAGSSIRLDAQLVNSRTKKVIRSFPVVYPYHEDKIFQIIDSLSVLITNFLVISKMEKEVSKDLRVYKYTNSPAAYRYFILADNALKRNDVKSQVENLFQAVAIDTNFITAIIFLSYQYDVLGSNIDAKKWSFKAYQKRYLVPPRERCMAEWIYARYFETPFEEISALRRYQELDDQVPVTYGLIGDAYCKLNLFNKAIPEYEKSLEIYRKWKSKPMGPGNYSQLGFAYHKEGLYRKERKLYKKAMQDFKNDPWITYRQAVLTLETGDSVTAYQYISKLVSIKKEKNSSDAGIYTILADLHTEAGDLKNGGNYYRQALSLEPEKPGRLRNIASFLIDNDLDIDSGLVYIDKALKLDSTNSNYLDIKGWGLYKKGRYKEAQGLLEKAWNTKPVYNHSIKLHMEEINRRLQTTG